MAVLTPALLMYCFSATIANIAMGISGFGSGIIMVLGWQVANMLSEFSSCKLLPGVQYYHTPRSSELPNNECTRP
eukprot:COSAG03_NODE_3689_length_1876_cov_1.324705_2_plen_74_part_01